MSTTKTVQISQTNSGVLAAELNAAINGGRTVTLNGETPIATGGTDAVKAYMNGTLAYRIAAKAPGKTRERFVKIGHMLTVVSEAPASHGAAPHAMVKPTKTPKRASAPQATLSQPAKAKDGKTAIEATVKGETGYLTVRTANGHYRYGVTLDETKATLFKPGGSADRHAKRAEAAGIKIAA
ncbi:hypothetical protein HOT74_gp16 [Microbacterium phage KaiHaiDragon]|uniref:Uncharacterized protein n=2 Tax=Quhwahvirus TaxID=2733202 RepID=A0AAE7WXM0_9CAUD|nr:hypothetical protein HOT74_gp16 [Microbacterium phage KaiHaiDragon]YP_010751487.1 hypothetical protein QDA06_gp15 [Microbacterium phage Shotgun]QDF19031.1 hypothetical protein SEA_BUSEPHILIS_16 [Microbacterium phage Busephilis]QXN74809.1 hypothetical protein SEA_PHRANCESCO_17 [Microbacterium phage Phrancesco]UVG34491.1 hypothetical protein EARICKHC_16 [Microbacterium phage EarickHC]AXH70128.1 hypothetical protein SEA_KAIHAIDRAGON_16 [Microbacterium phage KaiHaiDragon]QYW07472.1 hypothetica